MSGKTAEIQIHVEDRLTSNTQEEEVDSIPEMNEMMDITVPSHRAEDEDGSRQQDGEEEAETSVVVVVAEEAGARLLYTY
jgi:hypothetical protein